MPRPALRSILLFVLIVLASFDFFNACRNVLHLPNTVHVNYYSQLADGFLHGRLDVLGADPRELDLSPYCGRVYAYWPPLTAVLMMPLVAWRGTAEFPQRIFAMCFGALAAGFYFLLAERLWKSDAPKAPRWASLFSGASLGWGSSNLIFSVVANHWFLGQLTADTMLAAALWVGIDRDARRRTTAIAGAGCLFALATLGRQNLILSLPFWLYLAFSDENFNWPKTDLKDIFFRGWESRKRFGLTVTPALLIFLLLLAYNHARFGQWFEAGIRYHNMSTSMRADFNRYGCFNWHYLARNLYFMVIRPPGMAALDHQASAMGFSLFLQCPVLLWAFLYCRVSEKKVWRGLWIAALLSSLPCFLIMSPGFGQFGARYLYDVFPFLAAAVLLARPYKQPAWWLALGILSIGINLLGPACFLGKLPF